MEVIWLDDALQDLREIGLTIANDDPVAAYRVLTKIEAAANSLEHHPELGRTGRIAKTRELIIAGLPYILPYSIKKKTIRILAVMHSSRKWPDTFTHRQ
ncbi:MAG: type II toxin-antitoxin system RelE/ParE family toxin [Nitrospirales bacterium]